MRSRISICFSSAVALIALLVSGCAGNGEGLDANGRPIVPGGSTQLPLSDNFESLQENIFTPICSVCHAGATAPEGLRLDAANSYNLLVGVPSTEVPSILRVRPGDPDNSYIIQKLEGHAAVGAQMPLGGPYLSTETIGFIREWITNGAQPAGTSTTNAPLAITSIVPDDKEVLPGSPPQVMVAFNSDLDASQIATYAMHIEQVVPGDVGQVKARVAVRISLSGANLRALMIWPARTLSTGRYRLVMDAGAARHFSDIAGHTVAAGIADELGEPVIATFEVKDHQ